MLDGGAGKSDLLIISYESFGRFAAELNAARVGALVCDEGHRLKNVGGTKTLRLLAASPARRRRLLTGTPVQNNLGEFYALANFVNEGVLGELATFRNVYARAIEAGGERGAERGAVALRAARAAALHATMARFFLRRTAADVAGALRLPPKTEVDAVDALSRPAGSRG